MEESNHTGGVNNPKVVSIISYLALIGWIIAFLLNKPRSELASFHLRQSLGINLMWVAGGFFFIIPILGWIAGVLTYVLALVLWIIGIVGAIEGEQKIVPVLGEKFQEWFQGL